MKHWKKKLSWSLRASGMEKAGIRLQAMLSLILLVTIAFPMVTHAREPGQIKEGKWSGYLKLDGREDAIAVTMDSALVKPRPGEDFQILRLIFKLNLGGYGSTEYETEIFDDPAYDWDQNILVLDDPKNELKVKATIEKATKPILEGQVIIRSSPGVTGQMRLVYRSNGPINVAIPEKLTPSLAGQYEGLCGSRRAVLQIETGKGLTWEVPVATTGLHHYNVTGGLGVENGWCTAVNRPGRPVWCTDHGYSSGIYDFFEGKLMLTGTRHTDECTREGDELTCRTQIVKEEAGKLRYANETCRLRKVEATPNGRLRIFQREFSLEPTADQLKPLPKWSPPASEETVKALNGSFFGYLHHEYRDRYQPIRLSVVASTSSDNPHKQNDVLVSVTAVQYFGPTLQSPTLPFAYDRRLAYLVPGVMLDTQDSDVFLLIHEWRKGFVSGVWFSKSFGRVGTFEVTKGDTFPPLDPTAKRISDPSGTFRGPKEVNGEWDWTLNTAIPKQPRTGDRSYLVLKGNYRSYAGDVLWPIRPIPRAAYDLYTGAFFWLTDDGNKVEEPRIVRGYLEEGSELKLFWPSTRKWPVPVLDQEWGTYPRIEP